MARTIKLNEDGKKTIIADNLKIVVKRCWAGIDVYIYDTKNGEDAEVDHCSGIWRNRT